MIYPNDHNTLETPEQVAELLAALLSELEPIKDIYEIHSPSTLYLNKRQRISLLSVNESARLCRLV